KNRLMTESSVAKATTTTAAAAMTMTTTTSLALTEMVDRDISANEALLNDLKEVRRISCNAHNTLAQIDDSLCSYVIANNLMTEAEVAQLGQESTQRLLGVVLSHARNEGALQHSTETLEQQNE